MVIFYLHDDNFLAFETVPNLNMFEASYFYEESRKAATQTHSGLDIDNYFLYDVRVDPNLEQMSGSKTRFIVITDSEWIHAVES